MNVSRIDLVRAWKDPEYREGLSEAEREALPANPAGLVELADAELAGAAGGAALAAGILNTFLCITTRLSLGTAATVRGAPLKPVSDVDIMLI